MFTAARRVLARRLKLATRPKRHRHSQVDADTLPVPLRGELFNPDQLEQHARDIAATHVVTLRAGNMRPLQAMLDQNEQQISAAHDFLLDTTQRRREITPAAEWLLDNIHIVVDQIREIRQDLPLGYYNELPKLNSGPF